MASLRAATDASPAPAEPLVGRRPELALIQMFLDEASKHGASLLLLGEPGVGKTVLLRAAAEAASTSGMHILRAAGAEFESDVGFSGLNQALLPLINEFGQLGAAHRDALLVASGLGDGVPPDRLVLFTAALTLLRRAAEVRPIVVILDDVQWLDRSSAAVFGFVARRLAGSRVGLVAASRLGSESFLDLVGMPAYELPPLDDESSARLLDARFPSLDLEPRRRVLAAADGNPLALLELPPTMSDPARTAPDAAPVARRLRTRFAARISTLPARTRDALLLMALEGSASFGTHPVAPAYVDLDDLAPAERAHLLQVQIDEGAPKLGFRHPLLPAVVVELATSSERREAHRALADAFSDQSDRRAWHLAEAAVGADEEVAGLLEEAAHRTLRRGDAIGAVSALSRAADLSAQGLDRARRLAEAAYVGAEVTGDLHRVSKRLLDARRADPQRGGSLRAAVAAAHLLLSGEGDVDTAHRLLVGAIETEAGHYDAGDQALTEALYALLLVCRFAGRRLELWVPFDAAMARLRRRPPALLALCATMFADPARTTPAQLAELEALIANLCHEVDPARIVRIASAASLIDRLSGCREALWRVVDDGRKGGAVASAITALTHLCFDDVHVGRWHDAEQLADEGLALCESHGYQVQVWPLRLAMALLAARRGEHERTRSLTEDMLQWALPRGGLLVEGHSHHARALAALGRGDYEEAYEHCAAISPPGTLRSRAPLALWSAMDLVEAAVKTDRKDEAGAHVAAMREAGLERLSSRLALLTHGSAAITAPLDTATGLFEVALAIPGLERWPFDLARVRLAYGEHLQRIGAIAQSRTQIGAALDAFEKLGANPWAARAATALRGRRQASSSSGQEGSQSLTPLQLEIATLAATGMTNKEIGQRLFLSHRTVGAHLYRVYPKLGIRSRAGIADALQRMQSSRH